LENHLRTELSDLAGPFSVAQFHGGHANLTYLLRFGDKELVLRRPPFGKIAPGAHDMRREYKVLSKLWQYFPAAPRAFHLGTNSDIIGSDFIVMERRSGVVVRNRLPEVFQGVDRVEERLSSALMKVCADLHLVEVELADLTDLGKPEDFAIRQLKGWTKRWNLAKLADNPEMDRLAEKLSVDIPAPQRVSIVHGDLKFDNCQFQADDPDRVSSVFDWDMATLGDPLIDLGGLLSFWPDPAVSQEEMPVQLLRGNWPSKQWLKDKYATFSGLDLSRMDWYEAFAYFKTAVIAQQLYSRYAAGDTKDERMEKFGSAARVFAHLGNAKLPN
jgi:aminoglycoside phosphotransferase (APT) family kinase protein